MPTIVKESLNSGIDAMRIYVQDLDRNALRLTGEELKTARKAAFFYIVVATMAVLI